MIFFVLSGNGHFHNVVSALTDIVKLDVEKDNVVSTLPNVVHINFEIRNVDSTALCFKIFEKMKVVLLY